MQNDLVELSDIGAWISIVNSEKFVLLSSVPHGTPCHVTITLCLAIVHIHISPHILLYACQQQFGGCPYTPPLAWLSTISPWTFSRVSPFNHEYADSNRLSNCSNTHSLCAPINTEPLHFIIFRLVHGTDVFTFPFRSNDKGKSTLTLCGKLSWECFIILIPGSSEAAWLLMKSWINESTLALF